MFQNIYQTKTEQIQAFQRYYTIVSKYIQQPKTANNKLQCKNKYDKITFYQERYHQIKFQDDSIYNSIADIKYQMDSISLQKKEITSLIKDTFYFIGLVGIIYGCYITSGIYHQKILKHHYYNRITGKTNLFEQPIIFTLFPQFCATCIGFIYLKFFSNSENNDQAENQGRVQIPWRKALVCGALINFTMWTYNQAVVEASFPAVVMVKSCSLLSVILVGVFCSRVKDKNLKLRANKIIIGVIACTGIFVFNFYKKVEKDSLDKPITFMSSLLLIASLIGDGFLPDLQAQIKAEYKPSVMEMYFAINKFTCGVAFAICLVTGKVLAFVQFFLTHDQIVFDIVALSVLNAFGQIVIYKMIKLYKQHIPAFVIGIRKCMTVVVNIIYFGHSINTIQLFAIVFVFTAIMCETYDNYLEKKRKQQAKSLRVASQQNIKDQFDGQSSKMTQLREEENSEDDIIGQKSQRV